jgi:hypothetical protein
MRNDPNDESRLFWESGRNCASGLELPDRTCRSSIQPLFRPVHDPLPSADGISNLPRRLQHRMPQISALVPVLKKVTNGPPHQGASQMLPSFSTDRVTDGNFLHRTMLCGAMAAAAFLIGVAGAPTLVEAGPCFDRCMTRCNLARGYSPCRGKCFNRCQAKFQGSRRY